MIPDSFNQTIDYSPPVVDNFNLVGGNKLADSDSGNGDTETSNDFMNFWNEYPRRSGMNKAVDAWNELMKRGIPPNDVVRAARKYSSKVKIEKTVEDYVKMPHTFLATGFFKDYTPVFSPDCPECHGNGFIPVDKSNPGGEMAECSCKRRLDTA
jgi:hypothetical protein